MMPGFRTSRGPPGPSGTTTTPQPARSERRSSLSAAAPPRLDEPLTVSSPKRAIRRAMISPSRERLPRRRGRGAPARKGTGGGAGGGVAAEGERLLVDREATEAQRRAFGEIRGRLGERGVGRRAALAVLQVARAS